MNNHLPPHLSHSKYFKELYRVQGIELNEIKINIEDLEKQLNIDTATWALDIYEKELEIKTDISKPLDERRAVIKSRWRGTGKLDNETIKRVIDSFTNGDVDVGFDGNILVKFNGMYGIPSNMEDVFKAIEDVKPAHLRVLYEFMYLYIKDIHGVMTIEVLENTTLDKFAF